MSDVSSSLEAGEFQRHAAFVRSVARRLEHDEARAEDLAQDAWLAAIEKPPKDRGKLRGWLARVVRNRAAMELRQGERRERREETVAGPERVADTTELVERMELHRRVVEAVLELSEPYRSVLVRRFGEDETPKEIARHLGVPEETVRTRLKRGLAKLREKLVSEFGGTPALFLASLGKLTGSEGLSAPPVPPSPVSPTEILVPLVMKKAIVAVTVALAAVWAVWSVASRPEQAIEEPVGREEASYLPPGIQAPVIPRRADEEEPAGARVALAAQVDVPETSAEAEPEPAKAPKPDSDRGWITLHVRDRFDNPVPMARVLLNCLRSEEQPASAYSWQGEASAATTDPNGTARLFYPLAVQDHSAGALSTASVGFQITHPDFTDYQEWRFDVADEEKVVVLEQGSFVIVSGWVGETSETIVDVEPILTFGVKTKPEDWIPVRDGRPSCSRVPAGRHALYLRHDTPTGDVLFSEMHHFELAEGEEKELHLELLPPITMSGVVDAAVPRPITNGEVELNLYVGERGAEAVMLRNYRTTIDGDGTFRFENLPPGTGELIAMCDGWAAARVGSPPTDREDVHGDEWGLQQLDPRLYVDEPYVLPMEPTGALDVTILAPDGEPLEGADVYAYPNVTWSIGYSTIYLERDYRGRTDADGRILLENLPADDGAPLSVVYEGFLMPMRADGATRNASVPLGPGETVSRTFRLERDDVE